MKENKQQSKQRAMFNLDTTSTFFGKVKKHKQTNQLLIVNFLSQKSVVSEQHPIVVG